MMPSLAHPPDPAPASSAKLWLQAACIFAAAVGLGVIYNGASPLGVRPPQASAAANAAAPGVVTGNPAIARQGYFNETLTLSLDPAPGSLTPARATHPSPAAVVPPTQLPSLTWPQVQALLAAQQVVVVDARTKAAYELGHIPGAVLLPANATIPELQAFAAKYPKHTPLVVYCSSTSCHTSQNMAQQLATVAGFKNVSTMPGGFAEYTLAQAAPPPTQP